MEIYIVYHASAFEWEPVCAFKTKEKVLEYYREMYGDELTLEEIFDYNFQRENEEKIEIVDLVE